MKKLQVVVAVFKSWSQIPFPTSGASPASNHGICSSVNDENMLLSLNISKKMQFSELVSSGPSKWDVIRSTLLVECQET
jgi:hypothetical protein